MRNLLNDIGITTRISILVGMTLLLMGLVIGLGLRQINAAGKELATIVEEDIPLLEAMSRITFHSLKQSIYLQRAVRFGKQMAQDKTAKDDFEMEREDFLWHGRMTAQEIENDRALVERLCERHKVREIRNMLLSVDYELRNIHKQHADYQFLGERVLNLLSQDKFAEAEATIRKITKKTKEEEHFVERTSLVNFLLAVENFVNNSTARVKKRQQAATIGMLLCSALILSFSLVFGVFVSHSIRKPLSVAVRTAERIAAGDRNLEIQVTAKDETGQLLQAIKTMSLSVGQAQGSLIQQASELAQSNTALQHEITERKQAEDNLKDLNEELESTVEKLRCSNQRLQEFTYVASHDLREPVRKITSFGQLLRESLAEKLNDDEQENLNFMIDGADRMQQMIEALLTYSRVSARGAEFQRLDLNEIIEQLKSLELAVQLEETGGSIVIPHPLPMVDGDPAQVRQLLQNLISNALKYHKQDLPPQVTVRAHDQNNGTVRVAVEDDGIGINEELLDDVFIMFRRLHSHQKYEGTGIGLAVCKKIVERHGGQIGAESKLAEGSTFWFTLPAAECTVAAS